MSNKEKIANKKSEGAGKGNSSRFGAFKMYSLFSVVILIAIALVFNIFIDSVLGDKLVFDLSSTGQNSITKVTQDYLDSLPADTNIRIVGLMEKPTNIKDTMYEYIVPLLDDYATKSNGKVTVEYIDPDKNPTIISQLDPEGMYDLTSNVYAVSYAGKVQVVVPMNCFAYDQTYLNNYGSYVPVSNNVESSFTNAIVNLTSGYTHKAYFVRGLQEESTLQFARVLSALGVESADLPASNDFSIPDDCELLILSGINSDITSSMSTAIQEYLNNGGKLFVAIDYFSSTTETFTNLNDALHVVNLHLDDYLISENDPSYQLSGEHLQFNVAVCPDYQSMTSSAYLRTEYSRPVKEYDLPYEYIVTSPILQTSASATSVQVNSDGEFSYFENAGVYNVGMYSTFQGVSNAPEVYVFGTLDLTSDQYISAYGSNDANVVLLRSIIRNLLPSENSVFVDSKPLSDYSVDNTKVTAKAVTLMTIVLMVILPLGLITTGIVVFNKRKNL
ncbi:ABC-type uncharacterized transport system [Ruminococcaceae bacterium KH2T8]|nr:ABC-type uncharacterized transport system [Ruminococcaceae bacterium KH2T8]